MKVEISGDGIRIEVDLSVPPAWAWALLTERQHVANWWGGHVELEARPGGRLVETWSDGGREVVTSGDVTRCDPPLALEMTWADHDWPGDTRVGFHLSEHGAGTRLVLDHAGWGVHPAGERQRLIEAHAGGWSQALARLAAYAAEVSHPGGAQSVRDRRPGGPLPASAHLPHAAQNEAVSHRVAPHGE